MMIVHKFGGTSVSSAARFASVADILIDHHQRAAPSGEEAESHQAPSSLTGTVVVVSAMSGVTNQLLAGAWAAAEGRDSEYRRIKAALLARHLEVVENLLSQSPERLDVGGWIEDRLHELERLYRSIAVLGELTARGRDHVAAFGETLSSEMLAAVLRERGVRAQALSATQLVITDDNFGAATPLMEPTRARLQARVKPLLARGVIPVVTGYIAATAEGVTTTLGRGGSDYTAALVGAGLDADEVWIWSDVDGILTADPNLVPQAHTLRELSYGEASNLAYYGADVLHPKTIRPVIANRIPLRILNSFHPGDPGTLIVETPSAEREHLPAIISTRALSLVAVGSPDDSWTLGMVTRALHSLDEARIDVLMLSQSFSEHSLNLVVRQQDEARCARTLRHVFGPQLDAGTCTLAARAQVATVSVVAAPGWQETGLVAHTFAALGRYGTRVIAVAQAASGHSVSFCIPEDQVTDTVRFLHRELGLEGE